jgi:hypothetical protein
LLDVRQVSRPWCGVVVGVVVALVVTVVVVGLVEGVVLAEVVNELVAVVLASSIARIAVLVTVKPELTVRDIDGSSAASTL